MMQQFPAGLLDDFVTVFAEINDISRPPKFFKQCVGSSSPSEGESSAARSGCWTRGEALWEMEGGSDPSSVSPTVGFRMSGPARGRIILEVLAADLRNLAMGLVLTTKLALSCQL